MNTKIYNNSTYTAGIFTIKNNILEINGRIINISKISSIEFITYKRHSLFSGMTTWFKGLIFILILTLIWQNLTIFFTLYLLSIILLIIYNYYKHKKEFYGLEIRIDNDTLWLKSDNKDFIINVNEALAEAMDSKKVNYIINMDNKVINNGIISKGNNNKNKVGEINDK